MFKICLLLSISLHCFSQAVKPSVYEVRWALLHPFAALKVNKINRRASVIYSQSSLKAELDYFSNGGKLDAFRHVFFMACFAQKIKTKKLRKLGIAHEKANYSQFLKSKKEEGEMADSLGSVMDLQNNERGFLIGREYQKTDLENLKRMVVSSIKNGQAVIMKRNEKGEYLDCNNNIVNPNSFEKKWNIPKCLVPSNE